MKKQLTERTADINLIADIDGVQVFKYPNMQHGFDTLAVVNASGETVSLYINDGPSQGMTPFWALNVKLSLPGTRPKLKIKVRCASRNSRYEATIPLEAEIGEDFVVYTLDESVPMSVVDLS